MKRSTFARAATALCLSAAAASFGVAHAQGYPTAQPIRLVVPFAPGGITDISARLLATKLSERLSQTVIVENKAGGNQTIGVELVARAPADGYTLIMGTMGSHAVNASLRKDMRVNLNDDFAAVSMVTSQPLILVVNPRVPANSLAQLLELMKANPGKYTFGSAGVGTSAHMAAELFQIKAGLTLVHVPYKGSGPMLNDLLGGQIDMAFDYAPTALPHVKSGRLRALAATSAKRVDFAPELPAVNEFVPGFRVMAWQGVFAPAKTPQPVLDRLSTEIQAIMKQPDVVARIHEMGAESVGSTRDAFGGFVKSEIAQWAEVVKTNRIQPE